MCGDLSMKVTMRMDPKSIAEFENKMTSKLENVNLRSAILVVEIAT